MGCVKSVPEADEPPEQMTEPGTTTAPEPAPEPGSEIQSSYYAALEMGKTLFDTIDANSDGTISKAEWQEALERNGNQELAELIQAAGFMPDHTSLDKIDTNKDGRITWEEYQAALLSGLPQEALKEAEVISSFYAALDKLKALFDMIDANADGSISKIEWQGALENSQNAELATLLQVAGFNPDYSVMEKIDTNKDGRITWEEFKAALWIQEDAKVVGPISSYYAALEKLRTMFDTIDANADGTISRMEWQDALEKHQCKELPTLIQVAGLNPDYSAMEKIDTNKDGRLTWSEFEAALIKPVVSVEDAKRASPNDVKIEGAVVQNTPCCLCM